MPVLSLTTSNVARETCELREGALRIVAVADTHSRPHPASASLIAKQKPDVILHAGDIGDYSVLDSLGELGSVLAVRGNIDSPAREVPVALTLELTERGASLAKLLVVHIGVDGPRIRRDAARLAESEGASLVVCGHSHVPYVGRDRGLAVFNPGSMGPRRFQFPILFGVIEVDRGGIRMHHVDCETGNIWAP